MWLMLTSLYDLTTIPHNLQELRIDSRLAANYRSILAYSIHMVIAVFRGLYGGDAGESTLKHSSTFFQKRDVSPTI